MIKTLRRRNPTEEDWDAIQRQGEKDYIKQYGGLCENCDGLITVCEHCDETTCSCKACGCAKRTNPDESIRRAERQSQGSPDDIAAQHRLQVERHRAGMPPHAHDCDSCILIGSVESENYFGADAGCQIPGRDLWFCQGPASSGSGSMIIRNSCLDYDYESVPVDVYITSLSSELDKTPSRRSHYRRIYEVARERGLIT